MTRAAAEPQIDAPLEDRLGYLRHIATRLDVASPDQLHGAAHMAPLAGLELPFLDLVAELNDATIDAGADADLDELERVLVVSRRRIAAELARLSEEQPGPSDASSHAERLDRVRLQGEAMTVEIMLVADAASLRAAVVARLERRLRMSDDARAVDGLADVAADLEAGHDDSALATTRSLLASLGVESLRAQSG